MCHTKCSQYQSDEGVGSSQACETALLCTLKAPWQAGRMKVAVCWCNGWWQKSKQSRPFFRAATLLVCGVPFLQKILSETQREKQTKVIFKKTKLMVIKKVLWYIKLSNYSNSKDEQRLIRNAKWFCSRGF